MTLVSVERPKTVNKLHSDLQIIRTAIIAELDATSLYEAQIDNLNNPDTIKVVRHILLEEKEHISELICLLVKMDKEQEEKFTDIPTDTCIKP